MAHFEEAFTHGHSVKIDGKTYHIWGSYKNHRGALKDAADAREYGHFARVIKKGDRWLVALRRK